MDFISNLFNVCNIMGDIYLPVKNINNIIGTVLSTMVVYRVTSTSVARRFPPAIARMAAMSFMLPPRMSSLSIGYNTTAPRQITPRIPTTFLRKLPDVKNICVTCSLTWPMPGIIRMPFARIAFPPFNVFAWQNSWIVNPPIPT